MVRQLRAAVLSSFWSALLKKKKTVKMFSAYAEAITTNLIVSAFLIFLFTRQFCLLLSQPSNKLQQTQFLPKLSAIVRMLRTTQRTKFENLQYLKRFKSTQSFPIYTSIYAFPSPYYYPYMFSSNRVFFILSRFLSYCFFYFDDFQLQSFFSVSLRTRVILLNTNKASVASAFYKLSCG